MRKVCIHIPFANKPKHRVELPLQFNSVRKVRLVSYSVQFVNKVTMRPAANNLFYSVNIGLPVLEGHLKTTQKVDETTTGGEARLMLPVNLGEISTIEHPNLVFDLGGSKIIRKQFGLDVGVDPFLVHARYQTHHNGGPSDDLFKDGVAQNTNVTNRASHLLKVYEDYSVKEDKRVFPSVKLWLVINETLPLLNPLTNMFNSVHRSLQILSQSHDQIKEILRNHHLTQLQHLRQYMMNT